METRNAESYLKKPGYEREEAKKATGGSDSKASAYNAGDPGLIPGSGRSPRKGNGNSLQYSCLENPMYRGLWLSSVHGVAKSRTRLSDFTSLLLGKFECRVDGALSKEYKHQETK